MPNNDWYNAIRNLLKYCNIYNGEYTWVFSLKDYCNFANIDKHMSIVKIKKNQINFVYILWKSRKISKKVLEKENGQNKKVIKE